MAAELGHIEVLQQFGLCWGSLVEGVAFLALGWLGYTRRSMPALTIAFVLLVLDGVLSIGGAIVAGQSPGIGALIMRGFFCVLVFRGMKAARQLRAEEQL